MMKNKAPLIFFGTPELCIPFLEELYHHFKIPLIITQPDTFAGRNRKKKVIPAAKIFALEKNIPVLQPESLRDNQLVERIKEIDPLINVVISYGKIIPGRIFRIPTHRTINVHFSLLPFYRGAAPVQRAIENGETQTGITIFEIVKKMDAGDIWAKKEMEILPDDTTETMWKKMSNEGASFLVDTVNQILNGKITQTSQDHSMATYAPMVRKEEGIIDWNLNANQIFNKYRAFTPWPGICFCSKGKSFKLTKIKISDIKHHQSSGDILSWDKKSLKICCGNHTVIDVFELQPQGKKPMTPYCYCMGNELPECLI